MYLILYQQSRFKKTVLIVSPKYNFRQRKNTHNIKTDSFFACQESKKKKTLAVEKCEIEGLI